MNAKRARLIRKFAHATKRDPDEIKKLWSEIPRVAARDAERADNEVSRRALGAEIKRTVRREDD